MSSSSSNNAEPREAGFWLTLADDELLAQCEVDAYRASGPGGQKRNKTSSAIRLRHQPTGLIITAEESRSQHENRARALKRLRRAVAIRLRNPIPPDAEPPAFYRELIEARPTLDISRKHPDFWRVVQHVLDVFDADHARAGEAAKRLRLSTGQLIRFLRIDPKVWEEANRLRRAHGHTALR